MLSPKNMLLRFFTTVVLLLSTLVLKAQTFPVQVTPQLVPPYTVKLSDYTTTTSEKLAVNILLTDVNEIGRRIRLKMYVEGQGLSLRTEDIVNGATPIFVDGGVNLRLTNVDLQPYFRFENLRGITSQQYNSPLPNGAYNYCFEVYDYFSGLKLSSKSCTTVFLVQNDPPILNLPTRDNIVNATNPQNILFTWSPRHTNVSNVQYEFTLKEIWDKQNPQANFLASVPFYRTTTRSTTLLIGPEAPQLLSGKIYGWQVRAFVSDGINETSVFKNDGKSEIFWFKYIENCKPPSFVISQSLTTESVRVNWQVSEHIKYKIQYRKKGFGDDDWFEVNSYTNEGNIYNLEPDTVYEFRVGGECTPLSGYAYSNIQEFTTPEIDEEAYYNCGLMPEIDIKNQEPLPALEINDTFTAGDFPVVVRKAEGSNGSFSGWGYITLPFLEKIKTLIDVIDETFGTEEGEEGGINIGKYTRIKVEFNNVNVNTSYQLTSGVVKTSYDANWGSLFDADEAIDYLAGDDGVIDKYDATNMDVASVTLQENGQLLIVDENGNEHTATTSLPVVVTDKNGDTWTVNEDGTVVEGESAEGGAPNANNTNGVSGSGDVTQISSKDVTVVFNASGYYGTDEYDKNISSNKYKNEYEFIEKEDGGEYPVLYKLISENKGDDFVEAEVTFSNGKKKTDIVFKTKQGLKVDTVWTGNKVKINLKKQFDFAKDEIIATVKPKDSAGKYEVAGKFDLWHAKQRDINLTLVSVDGASTAGVGDRINEIYNKAGVKFTINTDVLNIDLKTLDVGDSDLISNYTEGEKTIISEYKKKGTKKEQYYIFFLKNSVKLSKPLEGFMPLKRQFGFVFTESDPGKIASHEIGHGIFGLKHPWDQYNDENSKGNTDYLMDYGSGTKFSHMDWQKLHAPGIQLYWFQGDEAGEYSFEKIDYVCVPTKYQTREYAFSDLDGNSIILGSGYVPVAFVGSKTSEAKGRIAIVKELSTGDLFYPLKGNNKHFYWKWNGYFIKDDNGDKIKFENFVETKNQPTLVYVDYNNAVYVNGTATGEIHDGARTCPIIPGKSTNSDDNSRCNSFEYLNPTIADDIKNIETYKELLKKSLQNSLSGISSLPKKSDRQKGVFNHIQIVNSTDNILGNAELEILEDKFHLLNYNENVKVVLSFLKLSNNKLMQDNLISEIANYSIEQNTTISGEEKIVHIVVPYSNYESIFGVGFANNDSCFNIGYSESKQGIVTNDSTYKQNTMFKSIIELFKWIKKPLFARQFYLKASGEIVEVMVKKHDAGYDAINVLNIFESKYIQQIKNLRSNITSLMFTHGLKKYPTSKEINDYLNSYNEIKKQINKVYVEAALFEDITNPSLWNNPTLNNIGKFREVYILDKDAGYSYFESEIAFFGFGQSFSILWGTHELSESYFYDFDRFSVIDPIVYGIADVLSLIPIPYLDSIGDSVGFVYATARGNVTQASFFALGLALPVGAAYLKAGSEATEKVFVIAAKKLDDGTVEITEKLIKDVDPTEVIVSSPLTDIPSKAKDAKNALENNDEVMGKIKKYFDDATQVSDNLFSIFDDLPTGWTDDLVDTFKAEYNQSSDVFKALFNSADDAKKLEIAESWKRFKSKKPNRSICK